MEIGPDNECPPINLNVKEIVAIIGCIPTPSGFMSNNAPLSNFIDKLSGMILVLKKSPTLKTKTGGDPNAVFDASCSVDKELTPLVCLTVGIVSPGLIHCCKNVSLELSPSGVIEWNAGLKFLNFFFIPSYINGFVSLIISK